MDGFIETAKAFGTGLMLGVIFSLLNLPIPAPGVLAGVMGVVGIFAGFITVQYFRK